MPRRTTDSEERDTNTEVLTQRKGQRPQSQHTQTTMAMDLATFHPLPSAPGIDGKISSTAKKRSRNNTMAASDPNFNSDSNSKPRKATTRPPPALSPDPEAASNARTQPRGKIRSKLPIPLTSKSFKGKHELSNLIDDTKTSDAASMTAGTDSPNPRARKVQRLSAEPPISSIDFTSQRKKSSRPSKSKSSAATSVFMNLGGRRLSTPLYMSPPNVDLTASPRPASPGDDPILLVGSELEHARRSSRNKSSRRTGVPRYPRPSSSKLGEDEDSTMVSHEDSSTAAVKVEDDVVSSEMNAFPSSRGPVESVPKEGLVSPVRPSVPPPAFHTNSPPRDNPGTSINSSFAMPDEDTTDDSYSADDLGFIGPEFTIPIRQGSPSPPTLHRRSFTKLGQRKPTPRRLVLDGEGDVSMMAKTIYYEHGEDQVEPPSPSPMSRRRVRKANLVDEEGPVDEFGEDGTGLRSPSPYPRILDGLDTSREEESVQADTSGDMGLDEKGFVEDLESDASGYVHDPTGFEVLREFSLDPPPEDVDLPPAITTEKNGPSFVFEEQSFEDSIQGVHQVPEFPDPSTASHVPAPRASTHASPSENNRCSESPPPAQDSVPVGSPVRKSPSQESDDECNGNGGHKEAPSQATTQRSTIPSQKVHQDFRDGEDTGDEDHSSYDFNDDSPVVEVSSTNPRAAARAAVILRMHHSYIVEDDDQLIPEGGPRRSRSRHRSNARDGSRSSRSCCVPFSLSGCWHRKHIHSLSARSSARSRARSSEQQLHYPPSHTQQTIRIPSTILVSGNARF
ncbi:hypothetical protein BS47DRAFT_566225 [Hydnum rufescens UP504]|uniref:Uncharacterized protein n=1 Tax=Hydnum rufescens UP504 TaxID=1448309 RepID=A0A9P6B3M0_9AGAM|nr:hypothetical protein BS47DRAFT_566225 [Hydnum rufescens UP504]